MTLFKLEEVYCCLQLQDTRVSQANSKHCLLNTCTGLIFNPTVSMNYWYASIRPHSVTFHKKSNLQRYCHENLKSDTVTSSLKDLL